MTSGEDPAAPAASKVDPDKLELRARPRPAVRFRKGLIVGLAGAAAALVAVLSWFALDPPDFKVEPSISAPKLKSRPSDALEGVPGSYDKVPMLGPPLPGDLGRPILRHRSAMSGGEESGRRENYRRAAEERLAEVRSSALMVDLQGPGAKIVPRSIEAAVNSETAAPSPADARTANAGSIPTAVLSAGTIIPASLITGIDSDVPGIVLAQVTEPVRDSATGQSVLIPQGARLVGDYDSKVAYGQRRAMLSWSRIVLPDGRSIALDKLPSADRAGYSGLADQVDFHGWRLLEGVALSTALGIGTELGLGDGDGALIRALGDSAGLAAARAGDEIIRRNLDVKPTIKVRPGWPIRLILHRDLAIEPWKG